MTQNTMSQSGNSSMAIQSKQTNLNIEDNGFTLYSVTELPDKKSLKNLSLGSAKLKEGDRHYTLKLNIFPNQTFYLKKNNHGGGYTLFSKIQKFDDGRIRMRRPVGSAELLQNIKTHLRLNFSFPKASVYMGLYPEKTIERSIS